MNRVVRRLRERQAADDAGFSMIEIVMSLLILALVTSSSVEFFINNVRAVNGQSQRQQAVYLADQQVESAEALPISNLVKGRTAACIATLYGTPVAAALNIAGQDDITSNSNWDPLATNCNAPALPTQPQYTINGVTYTLYTFADACYYTLSSGTCGSVKNAGTSQEYRVTVDAHWVAGGQCSSGCDYSTSTLIDPKSDPQFNSNLIAIAGSYSTIDGVAAGAQPSIINDIGTTDTCTINGITYQGAKVVVTGTGFKANIRVWMSTGGGVIPAASIYQPSATEVDFCVATGDTPGSYTISIINTDGGHIQLPLTEIPTIYGESSPYGPPSGWSPSSQNTTLTGSGFEPGASFSTSGNSTWSGTSNLVTSNTTADAVTLNSFVGPINGATSTITATNPDASTATVKIVAPKVTSFTPATGAILVSTNNTVTFTGSGFDALAPGTTNVQVTNGNGTATVTAVSATSVTVRMTPSVTGTESLYLYNPDGGYTSVYTFAVDAYPTITSVSPTVIVPGVTTTVTLNGTGFLPGITATASNGVAGLVTYVSSTQVTVPITALTNGSETITLKNLDTGSAAAAITAVYPAPNAITNTPTSVVAGTSTLVTVTGTGFRAGMTATASTGTVSVPIVVSSTTVTVLVNASATKTDTITLKNSDGQSDTFDLGVTPNITGFTPLLPVHNKSNTFVVNGAGFATGATVTITEAGNSLAVSSLVITSSTQFTFKATTTTSTLATTVFIVRITNPDGTTISYAQQGLS